MPINSSWDLQTVYWISMFLLILLTYQKDTQYTFVKQNLPISLPSWLANIRRKTVIPLNTLNMIPMMKNRPTFMRRLMISWQNSFLSLSCVHTCGVSWHRVWRVPIKNRRMKPGLVWVVMENPNWWI